MTMIKDSYLIILKDNEDVDKAANDIEALAKKQGKEIAIKGKMKALMIISLSCKADFAAAVKKLPAVLAVEKERRVDALGPDNNGPC